MKTHRTIRTICVAAALLSAIIVLPLLAQRGGPNPSNSVPQVEDSAGRFIGIATGHALAMRKMNGAWVIFQIDSAGFVDQTNEWLAGTPGLLHNYELYGTALSSGQHSETRLPTQQSALLP